MSKRNSITFTPQQIAALPCAERNWHLLEEVVVKKPKAKGPKLPPKPSPEKAWISTQLGWWCREKKLELLTEHYFAKPRRWRFDWAIPAMMVAVEYEGIFSEKSRHTTAKGFTGDTDKYNQAQALGWRVVRVTALNYKTVIQQINKFLKQEV